MDINSRSANKINIIKVESNKRAISSIKDILKFLTICSILFVLGQWEHPNTPVLARIGTSMMQSSLGFVVFHIIKDNWEEIKEDINIRR